MSPPRSPSDVLDLAVQLEVEADVARWAAASRAQKPCEGRDPAPRFEEAHDKLAAAQALRPLFPPLATVEVRVDTGSPKAYPQTPELQYHDP